MPKVIPFKDTILVKRRKIGTTLKNGKTKGGLYLPKATEGSSTDLADVVEVSDLTFNDEQILNNAEKIVKSLTKKACEGDCEALKSLFEINDFIKRKSIKVGDAIFLSRYSGVDFRETGTGLADEQTIIRLSDIIGLVIDDENS